MFTWLRNRRRRKLLCEPWPSAWYAILQSNVGHYRHLSQAEQKKLRSITRVIVSEKHWEAHDGLTMTDEIRVTIAATASLLLLGVTDFYFDQVSTIIVFPHPVRRETQTGLIAGGHSHHAGEAWQNGQVVLSWQDVLSDSRNPHDGHNLVIHEFAHCLDGLDGEMGGSLTFGDAETTRQWNLVCDREFKALEHAARHHQETLLDRYGATSHAEFFAVASETFFEQPLPLKNQHPELFDLLARYYQINPLNWTTGT